MAQSKCPCCASTRFEMVANQNVNKAKNVIMFIQCASCGAVVGTESYYDIPVLLDKIAKKLGVNLNL